MSREHDITADELHRRLVNQYTEIARLAGALAHEIKNPLSTIGLNIELLAEDFSDGDSARDRRALGKIEVVKRECKRLHDILDDFLNFAKVRHLNSQPTDLNELVRQVLVFFRPQAAEANIEIADYLAGDLPTVMLDRESFHAAVLNLVLNAQQAMPDGGQLVVRSYVTADAVALDLIDTGCGMDEQTRKRIFEAFFSTKSRGSGLGLPTTKKIIEAHGGSIMLQSEPGRGTQFTIKLPMPARLPVK
jgi:signal transduction histidine kinase